VPPVTPDSTPRNFARFTSTQTRNANISNLRSNPPLRTFVSKQFLLSRPFLARHPRQYSVVTFIVADRSCSPLVDVVPLLFVFFRFFVDVVL
jgi:hypothetical protein